MFSNLLSYDPSTIDAKYRIKMATILRLRSELLVASAEVASLRARSWSGESGLIDLIDLKSAGLAKLREEFGENIIEFLKEVVDLDQLKSLLPMIAVAGMQTLKVPLPVVFEALGVDFDLFKKLAEVVKEAIEDL